MLFNMKDHSMDGLGTVLLTTVGSEFELRLIEGLLQDSQIPYIEKSRGAGDYMRVLVGFSAFGTDLYVAEEDLERANELLDAYVKGEAEPTVE